MSVRVSVEFVDPCWEKLRSETKAKRSLNKLKFKVLLAFILK